MNINHMRNTTLLFSALFLFIGMACNAMFYYSFADTLLSKIIYVSLGLGFDGFKVFLLPMAYLFFTFLGRPLMAAVSTLVWVCLTVISLIAAYGFFTTVQDHSERQALIEGSHYQFLNQSIANATTQMEANKQYASVDLNAVEMQIKSLKEGITERELHPYNNQDNPINQRRFQAEISGLESELEPLLVQQRGATLYHSASQDRVTHLQAIGELNTDQASEEVLNPTFVAMGKQFQIEPAQVKRVILTFTAFATELLGTFAALLTVVFSHNQGYRPHIGSQFDGSLTGSQTGNGSGLSLSTAQSVPIGTVPQKSLKTGGAPVPIGTDTKTGTPHRGIGTGTDTDYSARYNNFKQSLLHDNRVRQEIASKGNVVPLTYIQAQCGCSRRDAVNYARSLHQEGVIEKSPSNRYVLNIS